MSFASTCERLKLDKDLLSKYAQNRIKSKN